MKKEKEEERRKMIPEFLCRRTGLRSKNSTKGPYLPVNMAFINALKFKLKQEGMEGMLVQLWSRNQTVPPMRCPGDSHYNFYPTTSKECCSIR